MTVLSDEQLEKIYTKAHLASASALGMHGWFAAGLRAVADAAIAADRAGRGEPFCYASVNKQGDVTSVVMCKDGWRNIPLYTHPLPDVSKTIVPDDSARLDHETIYRRCDCCGHITYHKKDMSFIRRFIKMAVANERNRCVNIIEKYQVPVGNSAAGEMAADWTIDVLQSIRNEITCKASENNNV